MNRKIHFFILVISLTFGYIGNIFAQDHPKREFRAAWIHIISGQFQGLTTQESQQILLNQLDVLKEANMNAVIFQIRAEADAFY